MTEFSCHEKRLNLGPILIRCACFPFEMASSLISSGLAERADRLLRREAELESKCRDLSEELYRTVSEVPDRRTRAQLLTLRRLLYKSLEPVARVLLDSVVASNFLPVALKEGLVRHAIDRMEFVKERQRFDRLYHTAMAREQAELFLATSDKAFRKALYLASPSTLVALDRLPRLAQKQRRRLEETLHSYLMRAIGRAVPNGVWSGVAVEGSDEANSQVIFSLRLEPFAAALRAIANRDPWLPQIRLRVNSSLRPREDGCFEYFHNGTWNRFQTLDPRVSEQLTALIGRTQVSADDVYGANELVGLGVLISTLELPRIYSDSWSALEEIIPLLPESEQGTWCHSLRMLRNVADRLGAEYETLTLEALQSGMNSARCLVNLLLARYKAKPVPESQHVFLVDRRVALFSPLPGDLSPRLARAIRAYWNFDRYGMGETTASNERRSMFGELPEDGMPLEDLISRNISRTPPVDELGYLHRWHSELATNTQKHQHVLREDGASCPVPPGSALLRRDITGHIRIGSITPDPCLFYSRFNALFRIAAHHDSFFQWYIAGIQDAESAFPKLRFADIAFSSSANMNAAARRNMTGRLLDTSATAPDTLRVYPDATEWPKLRVTGQSTVIVPRLHSAALPDESDARAQAIGQLSFLIGRPNLLRPLPHFEEERKSWQHLPRLMLEDVMVSPERWTPGQEWVDTLRVSSGSVRYLAWRRYVRSAGLPDVVYVASTGADSELLLHSHSVLAIELLGRRLAKHRGPLLIQEAWPAPIASWLRDRRGYHYAADLAVAWHGDHEFWNQYLGCTQTCG